jgi:hypothetical protein
MSQRSSSAILPVIFVVCAALVGCGPSVSGDDDDDGSGDDGGSHGRC